MEMVLGRSKLVMEFTVIVRLWRCIASNDRDRILWHPLLLKTDTMRSSSWAFCPIGSISGSRPREIRET